MSLQEIKDRLDTLAAAVRTSPAVERIAAYRYDPPALSWKAAALILAMLVIVFFLGRCGVAKERDQVWRERIAASSSAVREVMKAHQNDIDRADSLILKALEATDERLSTAEKELAKAGDRQSPDGCPRIPVYCLRQGPGGG